MFLKTTYSSIEKNIRKKTNKKITTKQVYGVMYEFLDNEIPGLYRNKGMFKE